MLSALSRVPRWQHVSTYFMPLFERYNDWNINDGWFHDPCSLAFDHRVEAHAFGSEKEFANIKE